MKKYLSLLFVLGVLAGGCSKERTEEPVKDPNAMEYTVNGITDMTLDATDDTIVALGIVHGKGRQENLVLSVIDLPAGASATLETPSGIPSFATTLKYKTVNVAGGTYNVKIKAVTASNLEKIFNLKLNVIGVPPPPPPPPPDSGCAKTVKGSYTNAYTGGGGGSMTTNIIYVNKDVVKLSKLPGFPDDITAEMNCNQKTFSFSQVAGGLQISGSGNFSNLSKIHIEYDLTNSIGVVNYTCDLTK